MFCRNMVKFAHYLREAAEQSGIPASDYFDYKAIKKRHIKQLIETKGEHGDTALPQQTYEFADALDSQIERVRAFIQRSSKELDVKLNDIISAEERKRAQSKNAKNVEDFRQAADR